jgi:hypothetical protein
MRDRIIGLLDCWTGRPWRSAGRQFLPASALADAALMATLVNLYFPCQRTLAQRQAEGRPGMGAVIFFTLIYLDSP